MSEYLLFYAGLAGIVHVTVWAVFLIDRNITRRPGERGVTFLLRTQIQPWARLILVCLLAVRGSARWLFAPKEGDR